MTEAVAALLGALIGAAGGLAGGSFAALASLRASQTAARAALAPTIHGLACERIRMRVAIGTPEYLEARRDFERRWSELPIQQRILCPSRRVEGLLSLVRATAEDESSPPDDLLNLAGQALEKVTRMISAYSHHIFAWRARRAEAKILRDWLASEESHVLAEAVRSKLAVLAQ